MNRTRYSDMEVADMEVTDIVFVDYSVSFSMYENNYSCSARISTQSNRFMAHSTDGHESLVPKHTILRNIYLMNYYFRI